MKHYAIPVVLIACACSVPQSAHEPALVGGERSCIELNQIVGQRVERGQLIYQLTDGQTVRNRLEGTCPALERASGSEITQIDIQAPQLCRGDAVRVYDPVTIGAGGPQSVMRCRAGPFVPVAGR
jgi:hypothetical protein